MNTKTLKFSILVLLVAVVGGMPIQLRAGDASKPAAESNETKTKKPAVTPFHGELKTVDQTAKTIAVGKLVIQITPDTKITRDDQPAAFADAVAGDKVAGAYKKTEDGKLHATMIRLGVETGKAKGKKAEAKKEM